MRIALLLTIPHHRNHYHHLLHHLPTTFVIIDRCGFVISPNFPRPYNNSQDCEFKALADGFLSVDTFETEQGYDILRVSQKKYSGVVGPDGVAVALNKKLKWSSDHIKTFKGFKICLELSMAPSLSLVPTTNPTAAPSPVPTTELSRWFIVESGACGVSDWGACISSTNYPSGYPSQDACNISMVRSGFADVIYFYTEKDVDTLSWGGETFSGMDNMDERLIDAGEKIIWRADSSTSRELPVYQSSYSYNYEDDYFYYQYQTFYSSYFYLYSYQPHGWKICYQSAPTISPT